MITPEQFKEITGFEIAENYNKNNLIKKVTYLKYLRNFIKISDIIELTGIKRTSLFFYLEHDKIDENFLSLLNNGTDSVSSTKLPLFECLDILHKVPKHPLWDKEFRKWNKYDFQEINRLKDGNN